MNYVIEAICVFIAGLALGTIFFGGLWVTVKKAVASKIPALWFIVSFFLRAGIMLVGFYVAGAGSLQRILICSAGFVVARFAVLYFTKTIAKNQVETITK